MKLVSQSVSQSVINILRALFPACCNVQGSPFVVRHSELDDLRFTPKRRNECRFHENSI
jgi:hypothetical protein